MTFSQYLSHMLNKKNINQTNTVCDLQFFHATFNTLDNVTFNRWINNKTTPSLEKQLIIARYFEQDLYFFILGINKSTPSKHIMDTYNTIFDAIENSRHQFSYKKKSNDRRTLNLINVETNKHRFLLGEFYNNMEVYNRIFSEMDAKNHNANTTALIIKQQEQIIGHISINKDFRQFIPYLKQKYNFPPISKSVLINVGYYSNRDDHELLIGHVFCYLLDQCENTEYCYVITKGQLFLKWLKQLGGIIVVVQQEPSKYGKLYLLQFNLSKLLSQPFVFQKIQNFYLSYCELKNNVEIKL